MQVVSDFGIKTLGGLAGLKFDLGDEEVTGIGDN